MEDSFFFNARSFHESLDSAIEKSVKEGKFLVTVDIPEIWRCCGKHLGNYLKLYLNSIYTPQGYLPSAISVHFAKRGLVEAVEAVEINLSHVA